jgi:hypothetical protein
MPSRASRPGGTAEQEGTAPRIRPSGTQRGADLVDPVLEALGYYQKPLRGKFDVLE